MNATEASSLQASGSLQAALPRDRRLRLALRLARMIRVGQLTLVLPDGSAHRCVGAPGPSAILRLHSARAIKRLVTGGSLGLAEAYLAGEWESPDLQAVMRLAAENEAALDELLRGRPWMRLVSRLLHRLRPNTRRGARRNIMAHYDLGNAFYQTWLDRSMTYSSALFTAPGQSLEDAQQAKILRLCEKLELRPGMRVLEIGCGWGGFAEVAARDYGVHVTGITLSPAQLDYAQARIDRAGLTAQVDLRLQDYRDVAGQFDRIVSVEMFEAVGEAHWADYFAVLRDRLAPGGRVALQVITIADRLFDSYRASADFIQRHVFPGGMLPSPARLREEVARAGLDWRGVHWFGQDYAETLARWHQAFQARWAEISALPEGYDPRFKRLWEYYLAYCETGFRAGWTDVGHFLLARPA